MGSSSTTSGWQRRSGQGEWPGGHHLATDGPQARGNDGRWRAAATGGAVCFVLALGWWFAVVNTANAEVGRWAVDAILSDWRRWRAQWEFGHAGHFVVTFAGVPGAAGCHVRISARTTVSRSLLAIAGNRAPWHQLGRQGRGQCPVLLRPRRPGQSPISVSRG
jgi:hypothetical protein